jgi:hypothetical protein
MRWLSSTLLSLEAVLAGFNKTVLMVNLAAAVLVVTLLHRQPLQKAQDLVSRWVAAVRVDISPVVAQTPLLMAQLLLVADTAAHTMIQLITLQAGVLEVERRMTAHRTAGLVAQAVKVTRVVVAAMGDQKVRIFQARGVGVLAPQERLARTIIQVVI